MSQDQRTSMRSTGQSQSRSNDRSGFNGMNPWDYVRLGQTVPSRLSAARWSNYAVESAEANLRRTTFAMENKKKVCELKSKELEIIAEGDLAMAKLQGTRAGRKALRKIQRRETLQNARAAIASI